MDPSEHRTMLAVVGRNLEQAQARTRARARALAFRQGDGARVEALGGQIVASAFACAQRVADARCKCQFCGELKRQAEELLRGAAPLLFKSGKAT